MKCNKKIKCIKKINGTDFGNSFKPFTSYEKANNVIEHRTWENGLCLVYLTLYFLKCETIPKDASELSWFLCLREFYHKIQNDSFLLFKEMEMIVKGTILH